jgi:hypothetical protein
MKSLVRSVTTFTAALAAVLVLAGCVATPPSEGTVVDKTYAEAHDETYTVSVDTYDYGCHNKNVYDYNTGSSEYKYLCEFYMGDHGETEERVRHHPDLWTVLFQGMNSDDEMVTRTIEVSKSQYEEAKPGYNIRIEEGNVFIQSR